MHSCPVCGGNLQAVEEGSVPRRELIACDPMRSSAKLAISTGASVDGILKSETPG